MSKELIRLIDCSMAFDDEIVLDSINLSIKNEEFLTLLGPSGCGKTTTLRIIGGGFLQATSGDVLFDGERINDVPPYQRKVNTVFQRYALFPHLDVYENVAFGLRLAKLPEQEIDERVTEMLEIVSLKGFENRSISQLSGGQQQRVAIARALVNRPKVLLLDEPLGALDLRLRKDMQQELKRIQQTLGITFVYVTHDQEEAMSISDLIVVMKDGVVQQIGKPQQVYDDPANLFVAGFMGTPPMSFHPATLKKEGNAVRIRLDCGAEMTADYALLNRVQTRYMDGIHPVILGVRPDDVVPWREGMSPTEWAKLPVTVTVVEALGGETLVYGHIGVAVPDNSPIGASAEALSSFLPAVIFLIAYGLAFATGTSWGTFGILLPIVITVFAGAG